MYLFVCLCESIQRSEDNMGESLLFFYHMGFRRLDSGHQAWQQVPLPAEPSCWLLKVFIYLYTYLYFNCFWKDYLFISCYFVYVGGAGQGEHNTTWRILFFTIRWVLEIEPRSLGLLVKSHLTDSVNFFFKAMLKSIWYSHL